MFSVTSQLNWFHKVLSFICQGGKLKLNIAFREGRVHYNGALTIRRMCFLSDGS